MAVLVARLKQDVLGVPAGTVSTYKVLDSCQHWFDNKFEVDHTGVVLKHPDIFELGHVISGVFEVCKLDGLPGSSDGGAG